MTDFAFAVTSLLFNRPEESERFLSSLEAQSVGFRPDKLFFSVDGYAGSKDEHLGRADRTAEVAGLVRRYFPDSALQVRESNLGIARHFDSAESQAFSGSGEWAVFLEDDFVLAPNYFAALERVIDYVGPNERVAIASATGDTRIEPTRGDDTLYPMDHAWAFALRRSHYVERQHLLGHYVESISHDSYFRRDDDAVYAGLVPEGLLPLGTSQDSIKQAIRRKTGRLAVTTGLPYGTYVGADGEHFNREIFDALGYGSPRPAAAELPRFQEPLDDVVSVLSDEEDVMWATQMRATWVGLESARADAVHDKQRLESETETLRSSVDRLTTENERRSADIGRLRAELAICADRAARAGARANAAEEDAAELRRTASWRLTAPLRSAQAKLRHRN